MVDVHYLAELNVFPYELFGTAFWMIIFGVFNLSGLYNCAYVLLCAQLATGSMGWGARMFCKALAGGKRADEQQVKGANTTDADEAGSDEEESEESSDADASKATSDEEGDEESSDADASEATSDKERDNKSSKCDDNVQLVESADKVLLLLAGGDNVQTAKVHLFYRMVAMGVVEFVHEGHSFSLNKSVCVTTQ